MKEIFSIFLIGIALSIGLALCVKIAGLHKAGFEIKSSEGTGTQVILSFKK